MYLSCVPSPNTLIFHYSFLLPSVHAVFIMAISNCECQLLKLQFPECCSLLNSGCVRSPCAEWFTEHASDQWIPVPGRCRPPLHLRNISDCHSSCHDTCACAQRRHYFAEPSATLQSPKQLLRARARCYILLINAPLHKLDSHTASQISAPRTKIARWHWHPTSYGSLSCNAPRLQTQENQISHDGTAGGYSEAVIDQLVAHHRACAMGCGLWKRTSGMNYSDADSDVQVRPAVN